MKPMTEIDEKGHITHERFGDGTEYWYDTSAGDNVVQAHALPLPQHCGFNKR